MKLTLSYAGLVVVAGGALLAVVWLFLLRYVPESINSGGPFAPGRGDLVRAFGPAAAAVVVFLIAFGLAGGWLLAGRVLAPLDRITRAAREVARGSLSYRIRLEGRSDELRELADAFDAMVERVERQVVEQQRFAANASHELRTPLAISQAILEVARDDPDADIAAVLERLRAVNTRAIALTDALLLLGRVEQQAVPRDAVDLSLLAEEAAEGVLPLAERRGVAIDATGTVAVTAGSEALLLTLTTNLVHNAVVHNGDGPARHVWITTGTSGDSARLTVENTGSPMSVDRLASWTQPFQRGTERIHDDHVGAGLGLAIAASIVRAHSGTLTLHPRDGGGLIVEVALPRASIER